jgi:hypothetical protein
MNNLSMSQTNNSRIGNISVLKLFLDNKQRKLLKEQINKETHAQAIAFYDTNKGKDFDNDDTGNLEHIKGLNFADWLSGGGVTTSQLQNQNQDDNKLHINSSEDFAIYIQSLTSTRVVAMLPESNDYN